ncbi:hypothetical protein ACIPSA_15270 [Streptomyces sp. NPDC086549]|uniref:hypothetical protein n=1 Tax=Streptomyces sp. NPDC086549 TaxID=3365752 RepID=UPI0037F56C68
MEVEYVTLVCDDVPKDVVLTVPGARVLDVAQVVRRLTGLSLWHSKVLTDRAPVVILDGSPTRWPRRRLPLSVTRERRQP